MVNTSNTNTPSTQHALDYRAALLVFQFIKPMSYFIFIPFYTKTTGMTWFNHIFASCGKPIFFHVLNLITRLCGRGTTDTIRLWRCRVYGTVH